MKKVLLILFLCLLVPINGYSRDIRDVLDKSLFGSDINNYELQVLIQGKYNNYDVEFQFMGKCKNNKGEIQFGLINGKGKLINKNQVEVTTPDNSKFLLTLKKYQYEDYQVNVNPITISNTQKINWEKLDNCKRRSELISDRYKSLMNNVTINERDLD